jgi:uncharacterized protein (UPF0371 family)
MAAIGFDNDRYLAEQSKCILERCKQLGNKLYLEFGGKILFDYHAARILPGFDPNVKMRLLASMKEQTEIVICIYAGDIERRKMRADFGITYDADAMKLIDDLRDWGLTVRAVVVTRYNNQPAVNQFAKRLERSGNAVYFHKAIPEYPNNVDLIVSDHGFGSNPMIETTKPIVVVNGPGPNSGKLATCLSQIYHEFKRGRSAGYAKFETFPIWNLPLKHPVNIAYEAATADLGDVNQVDPFHLEAYQKTAINYNRDIEVFPVVHRILQRLLGNDACYKSPTDMGVNRAGYAIVDDGVCRAAATQEVIRRYFRYGCEYTMGMAERESVNRCERLMSELAVRPEDRPLVKPARNAASNAQSTGKGNRGLYCGAAIALRDGTIIAGKNSELMHAASSAVLNAIKHLSGLPDHLHLLAPPVVQSITNLKRDVLEAKQVSMNLEETLIALSVSAASNPAAQLAMERLRDLRGCEMHLTHIPPPGDESGLRRLGVNVTSDPQFAGKGLFFS